MNILQTGGLTTHMRPLPLERLGRGTREEYGGVFGREVWILKERAIVQTLLSKLVEVLHLASGTQARPTFPKLQRNKV